MIAKGRDLKIFIAECMEGLTTINPIIVADHMVVAFYLV